MSLEVMTALMFYGASDDLIEVEGTIKGCDGYNAERAYFQVAGLQIGVEYGGEGTWEMAVAMIDEAVPVVAEDIRLRAEGYSMVLEMQVPASSYVARIYPGEES